MSSAIDEVCQERAFWRFYHNEYNVLRSQERNRVKQFDAMVRRLDEEARVIQRQLSEDEQLAARAARRRERAAMRIADEEAFLSYIEVATFTVKIPVGEKPPD